MGAHRGVPTPSHRRSVSATVCGPQQQSDMAVQEIEAIVIEVSSLILPNSHDFLTPVRSELDPVDISLTNIHAA